MKILMIGAHQDDIEFRAGGLAHKYVQMGYEDPFADPDFRPDIVLDMDDETNIKLQIAHLNVSQVYEWLPYTEHEEVPEGEAERFEWLKGMSITAG